MRALPVFAVLTGLAVACGPRGTDSAKSPRVVHIPGESGIDPKAPTGPHAIPQVGHSAEIWALAWNPAADRIATGSFDHTIRIWDDRGRMLAVLRGHREAIVDLSWSPHGDILASSARDGTIRLWDLHHAGQHRKLEHAGDHVAFSPDGDEVVTVGFDLVARIFSVKSGKLERTLTATTGRQLRAVAWSADGRKIAASSLDGPLFIWDAESGKLELNTNHFGGRGGLGQLRFSPDGQQLAGANGGLSLTNVALGTTRELAHRGVEPHDVSFSADGKKLITSGSFGHIHVWDVVSGKYEKAIAHPGYVSAVAASPIGDRVAVGGKVPVKSRDGGNTEIPIARIYDLASGQMRSHLEGSARPVSYASFLANGDQLVTASPELVLWDAHTGAKLRVLYPGGAVGAVVNPSHPLLALTGRGIARVVDTSDAKEVASFRAQEPSVLWSPDGATLVIFSSDSVALWNITTHKTTRLSVPGKASMVWDVAFNQDSSELAVAESTRVDAYSVATGARSRSFAVTGHAPSWSNVDGLAFGPTGRLAATLNGKGMLVFDERGAFLDAVDDRTNFAAPAFSKDGKRVAYAVIHDIRIWGAQDGVRYVGHDDVVRSIAWSPDGTRFASSSDDQTVRLWKPGRAQPLQTFSTYDGRVWSVEWHPSGKALLGVGNDTQIHRLSDGITLRMSITPGATAAAWFSDAGEFAGDENALSAVVLRSSDDLLDPTLSSDEQKWKRRNELLSDLVP